MYCQCPKQKPMEMIATKRIKISKWLIKVSLRLEVRWLIQVATFFHADVGLFDYTFARQFHGLQHVRRIFARWFLKRISNFFFFRRFGTHWSWTWNAIKTCVVFGHDFWWISAIFFISSLFCHFSVFFFRFVLFLD